jgi:hypothetical protein
MNSKTNAETEEVASLVPHTHVHSPNYQCTWYAQNYWVGRGGDISSIDEVNVQSSQDIINYKNLFGEKDGWATTYLPRGRGDYYLVIDHGWQTKREEERTDGADRFFSLQMDALDFPKYAGLRPEESLRLLNEEIIAQGWRGLGLWVRGEVTPEAAERFVKWSKYAGIEYWKIDGGDRVAFNVFKARNKHFPGLVLEYITGAGALNPGWQEPDQAPYSSIYDIGGKKQELALAIMKKADVFRTYDCSAFLTTTTTLRRTHDILKQTHNNPEYRAILNLEDDPQAAAGLGCLIGSMRHPNYMERTYKGKEFNHQTGGKRMVQKRINEIERFGRWQRIAPAFASGIGSYTATDYDLVDYYPHTELDLWEESAYGKMVYQSAPAIMARDMPLPKVEIDGDAPYVMATAYPNGPVAVATEGRVKPEDQWYHPRARVTIRVKETTQKIGIFGHYLALVIEYPEPLNDIQHIWAQDLLATEAIDIVDKVEINENVLSIPGEIIEKIGTTAADEGDISVPGLVLKLEE